MYIYNCIKQGCKQHCLEMLSTETESDLEVSANEDESNAGSCSTYLSQDSNLWQK